MGKSAGKSDDLRRHQQQLGLAADDIEDGALDVCTLPCAARISRAFSLRCAVVLLLSAAVLLSALFSLPFFRSNRQYGFLSDDPDVLAAEIQASFILEQPFSVLVSNIGRLEYDIFTEIGVPSTKVSIVSLHPLASTNFTYTVFAVLPDPKNASISLPALSVLRSSLVELVLQQLNLSLTPSIFGQSSAFEVLNFPGGITVIPAQSASIWEIMQILFNFKLNNSIVQIQKDLEDLKVQLKVGLNLRSYENVYVQITNLNGSTVAPPVIVQVSVLSDFGSRSLLPDRLKQLAQEIIWSHSENLGLSHSVFGKVKEVMLSSYLQHSIESPSPAPSPSPSLPEGPESSPSYPTFPYAYVPSAQSPQPPCFHCDAPVPSGSPLSYAPAPENGAKPPWSYFSPGPSIHDLVPPPRRGPCLSSSLPPSASAFSPHASPTSYVPSPSITPQHKATAPASQLAPEIYAPRPSQNGRNPTPHMFQDISPSSISDATSYHADKGLIGLLVASVILNLPLCFGSF